MLDTFDILILVVIALLTFALIYRQYPSVKIVKKIPDAPKQTSKPSIIGKLSLLDYDNAVVLFYGSQTGTAEDLASRTLTELYSKLNIRGFICDLDDINYNELANWTTQQNKNIVFGFFMATYGEGEPTDNAAPFYSWIMNGKGLGFDNGLHIDDLVDSQICMALPYFVFGLGNKTYEHYNSVGKHLDARIEQLGGNRLASLGIGDDDASLEVDYLNWKPKVFDRIAEYYGLDLNETSTQFKAHVPLFILSHVNEDPFSGELSSGEKRKWIVVSDQPTRDRDAGNVFKEINPSPFDSKNPQYARLSLSKSLFKNSFDISKTSTSAAQIPKAQVSNNQISIERKCIHAELDLTSSGLTYSTGDHAGIWADNDSEMVKSFAKILELSDLDHILELKPNSLNPMSQISQPSFPTPCSARTALKYYLDINAFIKQHHFEVFAI